jgi:hypothetical protein
VPTIEDHLASRQSVSSLPLRVFALVDALLYENVSGAPALKRSESHVALFDDTPDAPLADAGPWLIDVLDSFTGTRRALATLAAGPLGVSYLISAYSHHDLAQELRERLNAKMPDGRTALLRFYDARIIGDIAAMLSFTQRIEFFVPTYDWFVAINGQLSRVHPHA